LLRSSIAGRCTGRTAARTALLLAVVALGAGCRQDMHDAPRYDPLEKSTFFADGQSARPLVANTVARGLDLIAAGALDGEEASVEQLAERLGVGERGKRRDQRREHGGKQFRHRFLPSCPHAEERRASDASRSMAPNTGASGHPSRRPPSAGSSG